MTQEGGTPPDFWTRVDQAAEKAVDRYIRAGLLNNASISSGTLTIKGGTFRLQSPAGVNTFYVGPYGANDPDGNYQPGLVIRRNDGTAALVLWDPDPLTTGYQQFLAWYDRAGNNIISDDTDSGQGIARPYIAGSFFRTRYNDFSVSTTSTTFETLWDTRIYKQQPRLAVGYRASMDTSGTTGEVRVMVNGVQLGSTSSEAFAIATRFAGPAAIDGSHMAFTTVEIQGRVASGAGALRVEPLYLTGFQS